MEEYYEFGKNQTGVALIHTNTGRGTGNLIDVGIEKFKGRLIVTSAHVIEGEIADLCSVRFINENNEFHEVSVQSLFYQSNYKEKQQDIGLILLKESVDIGKFKPLKLNLSKNNDSLTGKQVNVFGCSPLFGKANSHIVFEDETPLRRGMTTYVSYCENDTSVMQSYFYDYRGFIKVYGLSIKDEISEIKIEEKIKQFNQLKEKTADSLEKLYILQKIIGLRNELINIRPHQELLETIYADDQFQAQLIKLQSTRGLDSSEVNTRWKKLIENEKTVIMTFDLGEYHISLHKPLPRLSAQVFHGDSGGAWVLGDEIVALSTARHCNDSIFTLKKALDSSQSMSSYFSKCEKDINSFRKLNALQSFLEDQISISYATSIYSCRDWIQEVLSALLQKENE